MSIEELERRVSAMEEQIAELRAERSGAKLDDVSQTIRSLRFDSDEHRKATVGLRHEIIGLRGDIGRQIGGVELRLGNVERLVIAIAGHLGVGGEQA